MVLKKLLGSRATRSLTVLSVAADAKRAISRGNYARAGLLFAVGIVAWKWALLGMAAHGVLKFFRGDRAPETRAS
ncbi:hypothetical protein OB905_08710 [Halobacteria archaeon AArc-dxtr1]|nr:hypothetical protein [Halobacteria archaeon AArc-dxtr1]